MTFSQKLDTLINKNNSLLCVGLDPEFEKIPKIIRSQPNPQFKFNKLIIDQTASLVSSYKLNSAFYEARGAEGISDLKMTFDFINKKYPEIPTILDAKRADIGNTNIGYVKFAFDYLNADAITLHPYLGHEALKPFLDRRDKGIMILCRNSNPGAGELQDLLIEDVPLYKHVARIVSNNWNVNNNCMLVVGATYPKEISEIRAVAKDMIFLIPGIGVQGGNIERTIKAGLKPDKKGLIIHSARGIIFALSPGKEAEKLRDEINIYR